MCLCQHFNIRMRHGIMTMRLLLFARNTLNCMPITPTPLFINSKWWACMGNRLIRRFGGLIQPIGLHNRSAMVSEWAWRFSICFIIKERTDSVINRFSLSEFLLGQSILAAPVIERGATTRHIYLPRGTWIDANTNETIIGPTWLMDYPAPLHILPYFILSNINIK